METNQGWRTAAVEEKSQRMKARGRLVHMLFKNEECKMNVIGGPEVQIPQNKNILKITMTIKKVKQSMTKQY